MLKYFYIVLLLLFVYSNSFSNECSSAWALLSGTTVSGSTTEGTSSGADPCGTSPGTGGADWYTFTGDGLHWTVTTVTPKNYDTKIWVYSGSCGNLVCVGYNDDSGVSTLSQVSFDAINGTTYFVVVGGYSDQEGDYKLKTTSVDCGASSDNFLENGSCECPPIAYGWTSVSGDWKSTGDREPVDGVSMFYAGAGKNNYELFQEVNVSIFAAPIDVGSQEFAFSAYMSDSDNKDGSQVIVEYLDGNHDFISSFSSPVVASTTWTNFTDIRIAPAYTRFIKVRLIATWVNGADNDGYFDYVSIIDGDSPFPIELVKFLAKKNENNSVTVSWQTATETNNDYFTIEKSSDFKSWQELAIVSGAGNSNKTLNYSSVDNNPFDRTYYRLKQTDFDGKYSYSKIIVVEMQQKENSHISIYPNPAYSSITVTGSKKELSSIIIYNTIGQSVMNLVSFDRNDGIIDVDISKLSKGIYFIRTSTQVNKLIKE